MQDHAVQRRADSFRLYYCLHDGHDDKTATLIFVSHGYAYLTCYCCFLFLCFFGGKGVKMTTLNCFSMFTDPQCIIYKL